MFRSMTVTVGNLVVLIVYSMPCQTMADMFGSDYLLRTSRKIKDASKQFIAPGFSATTTIVEKKPVITYSFDMA